MALSCALATTAANAGTGTTYAFNLGTDTQQGEVIVVCQSGDNGGSAGAVSMATPTMTGETFVQIRKQNYDPGTIRSGITLGIFYCITTKDHASTDQITLNHVSTDRTSAVVWVVSASENVMPPLMQGTKALVTSGGTTGAAATSATTTTGSITAGDLLFGVTALASNETVVGDSDSTNGSWTSAQQATSNSGTLGTSVCCSSQYKLVTVTGAQTYNTSWTTSTPCLVGYAIFTQSSVPGEGRVIRAVIPSMHRAATR